MELRHVFRLITHQYNRTALCCQESADTATRWLWQQTQVASIERKEKEWLLRNKDDQELGRFDWLCVTSHTMGHPRWEKVFGFAPPLETLSKQIPSLKPLAAPLKDVVSTPVMVTMTSYPAEGAAADALARLPADILDVTGHPSVSRVSRQSAGGFISLVVHSTADFAA
jgi:hypothetical protein